MRMLKWIGLSLAGLLLLVLAVLVLIRFIIDPNDYKDQISALVKDASGYQLVLGGDLSWSFYPILGFESSNVSLAAVDDGSPFLSVANLALGIQVLPLFSGQLNVDQLQIQGVDARFMVDNNGNSNWQVASESAESAESPSATPPSDSSDSKELPQLSIPLVRVLDANIRYQDQSADTDLSVKVDKLELTNVQLQEPVSFLLEAGLAQADGVDLELQLKGEMLPDVENQVFQASPFQLQVTARNIMPVPLTLELQAELSIDLVKDQASLTIQQLQALDASMKGQVLVHNLTAEPDYRGTLSSLPIKLPALFKALALDMPETSSADALQSAAFELAFAGDTRQVQLSDLIVTLDQSTLTGRVGVADFSRQALTFDLSLDAITLDHYLPEPDDAAAATKPSTSPSAEPEALIPVEVIRDLNLQGQLHAGQIVLQQETISNLLLSVEARDGVLKFDKLSANLLEGTLDGQFSVDARNDQPILTSDIEVTGIELAPISARFMQDSLLSGKASLVMDSTAQGNTVDELLQSALGQMNLKLDDGVLHGLNLNAIVVDALRDQLATVESLYPSYQEKLPRQLRKDTEISKLIANAKLENGHLIMPQFEFFTGDSGIDASGKIDLINHGFDYQFGVVLSAVERNKYLKGTRWPVHCEGQLAGAPADWCRPDTSAMGSILRKAATKAIKDKGAAELGDKVGLEAEDREQLKDEVQDKLEAEEERAKRKIQQKLDKWLKR